MLARTENKNIIKMEIIIFFFRVAKSVPNPDKLSDLTTQKEIIKSNYHRIFIFLILFLLFFVVPVQIVLKWSMNVTQFFHLEKILLFT